MPDAPPRFGRIAFAVLFSSFVVLSGVGAGLLVTAVPFVHRIPESFSIVANGLQATFGPNFSVPHSGWFAFVWSVNGSKGIAVELLANSTAGLYLADGLAGSGNVSVSAGQIYSFFFNGGVVQAILSITGTVYFHAPLV